MEKKKNDQRFCHPNLPSVTNDYIMFCHCGATITCKQMSLNGDNTPM